MKLNLDALAQEAGKGDMVTVYSGELASLVNIARAVAEWRALSRAYKPVAGALSEVRSALTEAGL